MNVKELFLGSFSLMLSLISFAQSDSPSASTRAKIGIFVPLHLDSAFTSTGGYKYNGNVPKFIMPGLEFYGGAQLALDSLQKEGLSAEVFIIDTKDRSQSISSHISQDLKDASLLIGVMQSVIELKTIADAAYLNGIPFISATYPNDGGIIGNPSLVILNSTLKSHCQAIYKQLTTNYSSDNIIILSRAGTQEEKIRTVLDESNQANSQLKWKIIDATSSIDLTQLTSLMDSTKKNVVVCATLDEDLGVNVIKQLSSLHNTYRSTVIGMPTWDDFKFDRPEFKGVEILYSTPFITASGNSKVFNSIANKFKAKIHSRPTDMVYKGFEITYRYLKNMLNHQDNIIDLSDRVGKIFSDFDIQPVKMKTTKNEPDYYENKKVYFIKKIDGTSKVIL